MSTERFDANNQTVRTDQQIIGSGNEQTVRTDQQVIGSGGQEQTIRAGQHIIGSDVKPQDSGNGGYTSISLNGKEYKVIRLIASSGEAEVLEVEEGGRRLVVKYYFSNFKPKDEILHKLQQLRRGDIIFPIDFGYHQNRFLEINEYMSGGTLEDIFPVRDVNRMKDLVGRIMEALHACHQANIIHRDIKPVNIFFRNAERRDIVLGDFGISSSLQEGDNYRITTAARTRIYAAPELEMGTNANNQIIVDSKVDFYALGICLLEMWVGDNPFKGVDHFVIPRLKLEGRIIIPKDMDRDLEKLIKGLITTEPPKRWGYEEVRKWLNGEPVNVHFEVKDFKYDPYPFDQQNGIIVSDPKDLAYHLEHDQTRGARQLYSGAITAWINRTSPDLGADIHEAIEYEYKQEPAAGLTKAIYLLDPYKPFKSYDGTLWTNQADLGAHIEQHAEHYKTALKARTAPLYLFLEARKEKERADKYRKYYNDFTVERAFNLVVLDLQDNVLYFEGMKLENVKQFTDAAEYMQQQLLQQIGNPDSKVSVWLNITYPQLNTTLGILRNEERRDAVVLRYGLQTSGFRETGTEVFTEDELYALIKKDPALFTTAPDAEQMLYEAHYWMHYYLQANLPGMIMNRYLAQESFTYDQMKGFFSYFVNTYDNPFGLLIDVAPAAQKVIGNDMEKLQVLTGMIRNRCVEFYNATRAKTRLAAEAIESAIVAPAKQINNMYPLMAQKVLQMMNKEIEGGVHGDLSGLANNRNDFEQYYQGMVKYFEDNILPIDRNLPAYLHILSEQALLKKKTKQYLHNVVEEQVDYLDKGKRFYRTFLWLLAVVFYIFSMRVLMKVSYTGMPLYYGLGGFVVAFFLTRHIKNRPPNSGMLGSMFDPLHRKLGKWMYTPILNGVLSNESHPVHQQALRTLETEPRRSLNYYNEKVRIALLEPHALEAELKN